MIDKIKLPRYEFFIDSDRFVSNKVPTELYKNKISRIWNNYEKYSMMSETYEEDNNPKIINLLSEEGIIEIEINKNIYGTEYKSIIHSEDNIVNISKSSERITLINYFLNLKKENPLIGIFCKENKDGLLVEMDWLPIPIRNLIKDKKSEETLRSFNIFNYEDNSYLVSFIHEGQNTFLEQYFDIGTSIIFYDELESFSPIKLSEISNFLPNKKILNLTEAWDNFYIQRYSYFMGEHPYSTKLDPIVLDSMGKIRTFLIWLHRFQEYALKLKEILFGKTILLTKNHNEMNGEYVAYNTTYTPEIRQEIINKREAFHLYAIANDWFIKG